MGGFAGLFEKADGLQKSGVVNGSSFCRMFILSHLHPHWHKAMNIVLPQTSSREMRDDTSGNFDRVLLPGCLDY